MPAVASGRRHVSCCGHFFCVLLAASRGSGGCTGGGRRPLPGPTGKPQGDGVSTEHRATGYGASGGTSPGHDCLPPTPSNSRQCSRHPSSKSARLSPTDSMTVTGTGPEGTSLPPPCPWSDLPSACGCGRSGKQQTGVRVGLILLGVLIKCVAGCSTRLRNWLAGVQKPPAGLPGMLSLAL